MGLAFTVDVMHCWTEWTILSEATQGILGQINSITPICRDSDDDLILACARNEVAGYIVTGDEDLLVLKNYEGISVRSLLTYKTSFTILNPYKKFLSNTGDFYEFERAHTWMRNQ